MKLPTKISIKNFINQNKYAILSTLFYLPFEFIITFYCNDADLDSHYYFKMILIALIPYSFMCMGRYIGRVLLTIYSLYLISLLALIYKVGSILPNQIKAILGVSYDILLSTCHNHFLDFIFFLLIGIFIYRAARKACSFKPFHALITLSPLLIIFSLFLHSSIKKISKVNPSLNMISRDVLAHKIFIHWPNIVGIFAYGVYESLSSYELSIMHHKTLDRMIIGQDASEVQNIILVIGETATSDRHHYLYPQTTPDNTPNMQKRIEEQAACAIGNSFSVASQTPTAVAAIVSFSSPDHPEKLLTEQNLLELAHGEGYRIYWIDIQPSQNMYDVPQSYLSRYADITIRSDYRHSERVDVLNEKNFPLNGGDEQIIPIFEQLLFEEKTPQKRFIILHLHGSHSEYYNKYDQKDREALPQADEYDLTIHHTDRVLGDIAHKADQYFGKNYMLFYSSDHGEDLKRHEHGIVRGSLSQYRIPVLLTSHLDNSQERAHWCERVNNLRNPDGAYQQIMDKVVLAEMMGYHFDPNALARMKAAHRIRHVDGKIYDWGSVPNEGSEGKVSPRRSELD